MFPIKTNDNQIQIRYKEKFIVNKANTERYRNSAIPYFQRLLNEDEKIKYNEKKRYM